MFELYTWKKGIEKTEVLASKGIVASGDELASKAGVDMLKRGGNAVDAAVATAVAIGVVEPSMSSLGGGGVINIRLANGEACAIDGFVMAPKKIAGYEWPTMGPKVVAVPGLLDGLCTALERYGTLTLSEVLEPAIQYAEKGFVLSDYMANEINQSKFRLSGPAARILCKDYLRPLAGGEKFTNRDYAETLRKIAAGGKDVFYRGEIADKIIRYMKENGGLIRAEDLEGYKARVLPPVRTTYKGYTIQSIPGNHGGVTVSHIMKIIEGYDLKKLGHNSVFSIHLLAEAEKRAFIDRATFYGDAQYAKVPWEGILSDAYAEELRKSISMERSSGAIQPGNPWKHESSRKEIHPPAPDMRSQGDDTTSLTVIDKQRNMVCITQSLGLAFGAGEVVPETGMFLNDFMFIGGEGGFTPLEDHPNYIAAWKRPTNNHSPTIVLKGGEPFMTIGSPGGRRQQGACCQTMINVIEHGMGIQEAISAPRLHCEGNLLRIESRVKEDIRARLAEMGHDLVATSEYLMFFGGANGIIIDQYGELHGGADPRRMCTALGLD